MYKHKIYWLLISHIIYEIFISIFHLLQVFVVYFYISNNAYFYIFIGDGDNMERDVKFPNGAGLN